MQFLSQVPIRAETQHLLSLLKNVINGNPGTARGPAALRQESKFIAPASG